MTQEGLACQRAADPMLNRTNKLYICDSFVKVIMDIDSVVRVIMDIERELVEAAVHDGS